MWVYQCSLVIVPIDTPLNLPLNGRIILSAYRYFQIETAFERHGSQS